LRKTAILVGAGATLAEALPSQPARKSHPPLDATVFELCRLQHLEGRRPLGRYLSQQYGINPYRSFRMEEVFNLVYADAVSKEPPAGRLEAYWALIRMYRDAIRTTTNRLKRTSGGVAGPISWPSPLTWYSNTHWCLVQCHCFLFSRPTVRNRFPKRVQAIHE
jgi:hypothetical protein